MYIMYIYIMNFSNSLTCVFVFNVFPHPKLVPSNRNSSACFLWYSNNHANAWSCFKVTMTNLSNVIRLEFLFHLRTPWMPGSVSQNWGPRNLWGSHEKCESFRRSSVPHVSDQILKTTSQTCWRRIWSIATLHRN